MRNLMIQKENDIAKTQAQRVTFFIFWNNFLSSLSCDIRKCSALTYLQ